MSTPGLPLRVGDAGPSVRDLQQRLSRVGITDAGDVGRYDTDTERSIEDFQRQRGLVVDGICGPQTWASLVEADNRLGDRMLYLRSPMTRGEDVAELQRRLGHLGFDAGWVDGIFGPETETAVREFQHNQGLTPDGVVGNDTVISLDRISGRTRGDRTVAAVREMELLRSLDEGVAGRRVVIGEAGGIPAMADALARRLRLGGAEVLSLHHPDLSAQARAANDWNGSVYVGITLASDDLGICYFATEGFESAGGRVLARRCAAQVGPILDRDLPASGRRLPILRETRMPAVWCRLGPPPTVVQHGAAITESLTDCVIDWCTEPVDDD